ncbi:SDR family oxidoreductase [Loktanella sp. S4079]|uniref:SDR family oxidoreductase n=1 Tax=Loktanella sp. S4079 TaxID=579483 RepID=UPI0005FA55B9|nr:aldehyde reductase [Loktanella sp. S4079]KJZ19485.1 dihydrokaempferol 4-reductase [Loktanella sp. S4079]
MPKTVLLTGASGYIAKHIALQLLEAGYSVRGTIRDLNRADEVINALRPHLTHADDLDDRLSFVALDLTSDDNWTEAMSGVDVLMHTASPFPMTQPKDEDDLIRPAVDGALRALRAAHQAGIQRVIMTSSTAAINGSPLPAGDSAYSETNWTDPNEPDISSYTKSKTLAERAAWDYVKTEAPDLKLTVINPGFVVGAPLDHKFGTSVGVIKRILNAKDPMLPNFGFSCVDVIDVAEAHVSVIDNPATYGQRIMTVDRFMTFAEIAKALKSAYPKRRIVTRTAPDFIVRFLAIFDPAVRQIVPLLGQIDKIDNSRIMKTLGRGMRRTPKSVVATAAHLIDNELL